MPAKPVLPRLNNIPILPNLGDSLPFPAGRILHVRPRYGSDINARPDLVERAFKTIQVAFQNAKANQNDVILVHSEGNSSAYCTSYQSETLDWNKDGVHLIGVNNGINISPRSRLAFISSYVTASNLITVSANNCLFRGIAMFAGVADTNPTGCLKVTGDRNKFEDCHITGFGHASMDIAGAYSINLSGAEENQFERCTIGMDRITCGAQANSQLLCESTAKNNRFTDCVFKLVSTHATNHLFVRAATSSLDGGLEFIRTVGYNSQSRNVSGSELTYAMVVASDAGGDVFLDPGSAFQATDCNSTDAGNVYGAGAAAGILVPLTK